MLFLCGQIYVKLEGKKIYLIRHGQTGHNHRGIVQGRNVKSNLSKKGLRQAAAFFDAYKEMPFQKTVQTVQQFLDLGLPHEALPGLDEICWGESEGLFANGENNKKYKNIINAWKHGELDSRLKGGENPLDVRKRQKEALEYIVSQPEDLVLVCMHGRALKILLAWITGKSMKEMDIFDHDNLSLYILHYQDGVWQIKTHNDREHLHDI